MYCWSPAQFAPIFLSILLFITPGSCLAQQHASSDSEALVVLIPGYPDNSQPQCIHNDLWNQPIIAEAIEYIADKHPCLELALSNYDGDGMTADEVKWSIVDTVVKRLDGNKNIKNVVTMGYSAGGVGLTSAVTTLNEFGIFAEFDHYTAGAPFSIRDDFQFGAGAALGTWIGQQMCMAPEFFGDILTEEIDYPNGDYSNLIHIAHDTDQILSYAGQRPPALEGAERAHIPGTDHLSILKPALDAALDKLRDDLNLDELCGQCGDGKKQMGEECEPTGTYISLYEYCNASCEIEDYTPKPTPNTCGNRWLDAGEQCDMGSSGGWFDLYTYCTPDCRLVNTYPRGENPIIRQSEGSHSEREIFELSTEFASEVSGEVDL